MGRRKFLLALVATALVTALPTSKRRYPKGMEVGRVYSVDGNVPYEDVRAKFLELAKWDYQRLQRRLGTLTQAHSTTIPPSLRHRNWLIGWYAEVA